MSDESRWVVAPTEARIEVAIGRDAKVSPEVRAALDKLAAVIEEEQEVQGYGVCPAVSITPCAWFYLCIGVKGTVEV